MPLLILLIGGGFFFALFSRLIPYRNIKHAFQILTGRYDNPDDPGDINHFQALSSALAATIGMGNISGVAVAIVMGGPGAIFWMWVSGLFGMATKFFTCTLAIMYRGRDTMGHLQGGPMYVITEGLGKKWRPLAVFFSVAGLFGCLPMFQSNQLTQIIRDVVLVPNGLPIEYRLYSDAAVGLVLVGLTSLVIFGGIKRIGNVASKMVPAMVLLYFIAVMGIVLYHASEVPYYLRLIIHDAFTADAVLGGALGALIVTGIRRAAFSNEAGIGTESLAHGAAKTKEPVREGLVAMLGPVIDTHIVCTLTALAIIMTGVWDDQVTNGVTVTVMAFEEVMPGFGKYILVLAVSVFALTTMFTYSYYGSKCLGFLIGAQRQHYYNYFYVFMLFLGAIGTIEAVISFMDGMFAMMAIPTMTSALLLSPKVVSAARDYMKRLKESTQT
jgi:AGCS family alanine or glycine:cation symporter